MIVKVAGFNYGKTGIGESRSRALGHRPDATVVRGMLFLPEASDLKPQAASLHDVLGRKLMGLHSGANDVGALAPGVYFIRETQAQAVRKVVIAR
jgi:hypothetical protein